MKTDRLKLMEINTRMQIGVLTPYNAQVALLRARLKEDFPAVEIGSVDGFQVTTKTVHLNNFRYKSRYLNP